MITCLLHVFYIQLLYFIIVYQEKVIINHLPNQAVRYHLSLFSFYPFREILNFTYINLSKQFVKLLVIPCVKCRDTRKRIRKLGVLTKERRPAKDSLIILLYSTRCAGNKDAVCLWCCVSSRWDHLVLSTRVPCHCNPYVHSRGVETLVECYKWGLLNTIILLCLWELRDVVR